MWEIRDVFSVVNFYGYISSFEIYVRVYLLLNFNWAILNNIFSRAIRNYMIIYSFECDAICGSKKKSKGI